MSVDGNADFLITSHPYQGELKPGARCTYVLRVVPDGEGLRDDVCGGFAKDHVLPLQTGDFLEEHPHEFVAPSGAGDHCAYEVDERPTGGRLRRCGYPQREHGGWARKALPVRVADVQQYERAPMPDEARRGITVKLIDAPIDPLGTLAVVSGIYTGTVYRAKSSVNDSQRREAWDAMMATVLSGPLEAMQFTFLIEGVDRAITHQLVRNRFGFYAQESLRFAVPEDWAQEIPLPPSLSAAKDDDPAVAMWRKSLNQIEDAYAALVAVGMPAEEARGVLPHAITTRMFVTWSMRTILLEAGKRTCTQAQFPWRTLFAGIAKAFRERGVDGNAPGYYRARPGDGTGFEYSPDGWQYRLFAEAIRPVCYQTGRCGFKAEFDRHCKIRERVDAFERAGVPSTEWGLHAQTVGGKVLLGIQPREWAADPGAARVVGHG